MKKLSALFLFSIVAVSAFSVDKPKSSTTQSTNQQESPSNEACKINKEISNIVLGYKQVIYDVQKLNSDIEELIPELDEAIRKIDNSEITYWDKKIDGLNDRIGDFHDRSQKLKIKHEKLAYRYTVVKNKLKENPKLGNLIDTSHLIRVGSEWDALANVQHQIADLYTDKVDSLKERIRNLPYSENHEDLE